VRISKGEALIYYEGASRTFENAQLLVKLPSHKDLHLLLSPYELLAVLSFRTMINVGSLLVFTLSTGDQSVA
jgi:hypothetical protein